MADQHGGGNGPVDAGGLRTVEDVREAVGRFREDYGRVREQIGRVIVGHGEVVDGVMTCLFTGGHVLLEGVPGLGKTLLVRSLAQALSLSFARVQFTPDLMPADISGTMIVTEVERGDGRGQRQFTFQRGPIFAQIVLADEINRATPKTQSALLEAMQERSVTVGGTTHALPEPFLVMATQNPIEQEGTYPLPEAQLDRFFFKLLVGPPSRSELGTILDRTTAARGEGIVPILDGPAILAYQGLVRRAAIAPHVQDYAVRMVLATHPRWDRSPDRSAQGSRPEDRSGDRSHQGEFATPMVNRYVRLGASPRAAQALVLGAKCRALLDGRAAVSVDDIRAIALPSLRHRLILNFEAHAEGITPDGVIENIMQTLPVRAEAAVGAAR